MKHGKHLIKIAAAALSVVMLLSSVGVTALAAEKTPVGYIDAVPDTVTSAEVTTDPNYLIYKGYLEEENGVVSALYNGLINLDSQIDISSYNVPLDNMKTLLQVMFHSFPEIWYVKKYSYSYYNDANNTVAYVMPVYLTDEELAEKKEAFFAAAEERYLPLVDEGMDDFTKAVTLHDALVLNTYYPEDLDNNKGNNYTYMVENYGVCQFYSECYAYLLAQCGIRSEVVSSDDMDHAWLKIQLDGQYYNVDSTWDDPVPDKVGKAHHSYFLYSDEEFQKETSIHDPHYGYPSIHAADSTRYDSFQNLHKFETQLCNVDGTFYAITSDGELVTYDDTTDAITVKKNLGFQWRSSGSYYYIGNFSSLALYDGKLYYNSPDAVYAYDPATGNTEKFADAAGENGKVLYGLRILDDKLWGVYASSPAEGYIRPTYLKDMKSVYTVTVDTAISGGKVTADVQQAKQGDTVTLTVVPDEGYSVDSVRINGTQLTASGNVYTFRMPAENVTVTAAFSFTDRIGARVAGHSLSVEGDIGINFYMELDSSVTSGNTAKMHFTIPLSADKTEEKDVSLSEAKVKTDGDKTYYVFKCNVAAKEMSSEIKAQIIDGDRQGTEYTYSVKEYAEYLLDHSEIEKYAAAASFVKAMLNYGAYSQVFFDRNPSILANEKLTDEEKALGNITAETIGRANYSRQLPADVTFTGAALSLKTKTTLALYFESSKELSFNCEGVDFDVRHHGSEYIIRISGIAAKDLNNDFTVGLTTADGSGTITYSPMTYCSRALGTSDEKLHDVVKALYSYWVEADKYF